MEFNFASRMKHLRPSTIREILKVAEQPDIISFAGGLPAPELFPVAAVRDAAYAALTDIGAPSLQYGTSEGRIGLREQIAQEMERRKRITNPEEVLIVTGSQQGLDLLGKALLDKDSVVLTENPTYLAAIQAFGMFQPRFIPVETDSEGVVPEALEALVRKYQPRFLYTIPTFQNPTGKTLSLSRRKALVKEAERLGLLIIEDDPYSRLRYSGETVPPLAALNPDMVYLSTFSKTVAPGLRTGWIIAPKSLREKLIIAKQAADLHTSSMDQAVLERYLKDADSEAHIEKVRTEYGKRYAVMDKALSDCMPASFSWTHPEGGMFLWVEGPSDLDTVALLPKALETKVAYVPGRDFFPKGESKNSFRLNFSNASEDRIREGIERLASLFKESR